MEKAEAIREWCVKKALSILIARNANVQWSTKEVVEVAKELEKYIKG